MKKIFTLSFLLFLITISSQEKELLIDTIFIKSFSKEMIVSTLKKSKKNFAKFHRNTNKYNADFELFVNKEKTSNFNSIDFDFIDFKNRKYTVKKTIDYENLRLFEFDPNQYFYRLKYLYNYSELNYLKNFENFNYKMREINGLLQITCFSKKSNLKSIIVLDKLSSLPKAIYQTLINPSYNVTQNYSKIDTKNDSEVTYDVITDDFTIIYRLVENNLSISELSSNTELLNYTVKRTDKQKQIVFSKNIGEISSNIKLQEHD